LNALEIVSNIRGDILMTITVETTVDIGRPPEDVFAVLADIPNSPEWIAPVIAVRDFSGEPVGVGTTYTQVTKFLGKEFTIDVEVTDFEPDERYGERFAGGIPGDMAITLNAVDGGTRLHLHFEGEPSGIFGIAAPLLKSNMQKQITSDMNTLKALLEGSA
jgi:uncharacterized membrane protein